MPVTASDLQRLILAEVQDTPDARVAVLMPTIWGMFADKDAIAPRLRYLSAKRTACDVIAGYYRDRIDTGMAELSSKDSQYLSNILEIRAATQDELVQTELRARGQRVVSIAALTNLAPEVNPLLDPVPSSQYISGNDPRYQGDVYQRPFQTRD